MSFFFWLVLLCRFHDVYTQYKHNLMWWDNHNHIMNRMCVNMSRDIMKDSHSKVVSVYKIRQMNLDSAAYEIGYLTQAIHENYRRMLDKHAAIIRNITIFYTMEITLYLEEIEKLYWVIEHQCNMLNEIERKYQVKGDIDDVYVDPRLTTTEKPFESPDLLNIYDPKKKPKKSFDMKKYLQLLEKLDVASTTTKKNKGPFPIDYGWEIYNWNSAT